MAEAKNCPQCGSTMNFRLGTYECPQCGHSGTGPPAGEAPAAAGRVGQRRESWQPDQPLRGTPAAAPPEARQELEIDPLARPVGERPSGLELEKRIYFGITAAITIVGALGSIFSSITGGGSLPWLLSSLFWDAVGLFLLAYVLFSGEAWARGCCAVLVALELIALIGGAFITIPFISAAFGVSWLVPAFLALPFWGAVAVEAAWYGWLLSILWRDHTGA
jgi:hypothetical protein